MNLKEQLIFGIVFILAGCNSGHTHVETTGPNEGNNITVMHGQSQEIKSAFNTLENLFNSPEDFRLKTIYSSEIDSLETIEGTIPKEIFFYYKVSNNDTLYCSKFFVQNNIVSTIFHMYTEEEKYEFEIIRQKSDTLIENGFKLVEKVINGADSTL